MASKRQFHADVVKSDAFLNLSSKAKLLYFYINMDCDNCGLTASVRNPMYNAESTREELQELINKGFIIDMGDDVYCVKHWRKNNTLQKDRNGTTFSSKYALLDEVDKVYYLKQDEKIIQMESKWNPNEIHVESKWNPNGIQMDSQAREGEARQEEKRQEEARAEEARAEEGRLGGESHSIDEARKVLSYFEKYAEKKEPFTFTDEQLKDFADLLPRDKSLIEIQDLVYQCWVMVGNGKLDMDMYFKPFEVMRKRPWETENKQVLSFAQ